MFPASAAVRPPPYSASLPIHYQWKNALCVDDAGLCLCLLAKLHEVKYDLRIKTRLVTMEIKAVSTIEKPRLFMNVFG